MLNTAVAERWHSRAREQGQYSAGRRPLKWLSHTRGIIPQWQARCLRKEVESDAEYANMELSWLGTLEPCMMTRDVYAIIKDAQQGGLKLWHHGCKKCLCDLNFASTEQKYYSMSKVLTVQFKLLFSLTRMLMTSATLWGNQVARMLIEHPTAGTSCESWLRRTWS